MTGMVCMRSLGVLLLLAFVLALGANAEMIAYYNFETNCNNVLGTGYDLTVLGGDPEPGWSGGLVSRTDGDSYRPGGKVGNCVNLVDIDNDRLQAVGLDTDVLGDSFSIATWFYLVYPDGNASPRFHLFEPGNNYDASFGTSSTYQTDGGLYKSYVGGTEATAARVSVSEEAWHHVVQTYSASAGTTVLSVYIDGSYIGSQSVPTSSVDFEDLNIGCERNPTGTSGDRDWDGLVDELAVWDHALDLSEVTAVRSAGLAGQPLYVPEPGSLVIAMAGMLGLALFPRRKR